ncbi:MAG: SDR family oxidoreductase [Candidatus Hydrogenedentes bacterium]|nr:SDR family oxidoreductase [Candidatus Hydrogenedentota bacterium]
MANYLVTGGAGFIGSNLVEHLLARGEAVRVLDNLSTGRRHNLDAFRERIEFIEGDIREPGDCAQAAADMDYVLHQAALPSVPRSLADPATTHAVNVTGALNLLVAARDAKVRRFVFASSSSVYGDQAEEFKHEGLPLCPMSPYAASKAAGEHYLRAFSQCFGLETVALRYFNVFGPRQDPDSPYSAVIPLFIMALLRGEQPVIYGDGLQARDFTYVENVVSANVLAATGSFEARGQAYNIACGEAIGIAELLALIAASLDVNVKPVYREGRSGDVRTSKARVEAASKAFGFRAGVDAKRGLHQTVAFYSAAHRGAGR